MTVRVSVTHLCLSVARAVPTLQETHLVVTAPWGGDEDVGGKERGRRERLRERDGGKERRVERRRKEEDWLACDHEAAAALVIRRLRGGDKDER